MMRRLLAAVIAGCVLGCGVATLPRVRVYEEGLVAAGAATYAGVPVRSGQIILSESPLPTSVVFMLIPDKFYGFTHAGIVVVEDGEPWIYEASGALAKWPFHERVLDNVSGRITRRRLFEYVAPNLYAEIVDLPAGVDGENVAAFAREQYRRKAAFDPYFRWDEHERLFCTEFVELALRAGGAPPREPGPTLEQPSLLVAKEWLGVPLREALPAGAYHDPARVVAALGQLRSRGVAFAYFEAKRELYRRFSFASQRMGYLFKLRDDGAVELREDVAGFLEGAVRMFDAVPDPPAWGDPRVTRLVRAYAEHYFGPAPN